ncbi:C40 family peptidase (plasmid) [Clostridium perfringens]
MNKAKITTVLTTAIALGVLNTTVVLANEVKEVVRIEAKATVVSRGQVINVKSGSNLNIRESASTKAAIVGKISGGQKFDILGKSGSWYKIKYESVTGYVHGDYVKEIKDNGTSTESTNSGNSNGTSASSNRGQVINVKQGSNLNIRKSSSTSSSVVGKLPYNAKFDILSKSNGWYKIKYKDITGYVHGDYVKEISSTSSNSGSNSESGNSHDSNTNDNVSSKGKGQVVNVKVGSSLNIRKSSSTSSSVVGKLPHDAKFDILSKTNGWYKIKYKDITGYVHGDYVKEISSTSSNSGSSNNDSNNNNSGGSSNNENTESSKKQYGRVINVKQGSNLRVRSEANTSSSVLGCVYPNDKVEIKGKSGLWYKIVFKNVYGYVHSDYIEIIKGGGVTPETSPDKPDTNIPNVSKKKFEEVLSIMKEQLGSPYVYGGAGEIITQELLDKLKVQYPTQGDRGDYDLDEKYLDGTYRAFDCSGLMQWSFGQAGVKIGRNTKAQIKDGVEINIDDVQPGDLIFYSDLNHVGMYIGNDEWVESPRAGLNVRISKVPWSKIGRARRVI